MKRFIILLIGLICSWASTQAQQQPLLSLQPAYPSWYNPGATAYSTGHTFSFGYRSQWGAIEDAPNTQLLAFDTRNKVNNLFGFGATIMRESAHRDQMFAFQGRTAFHLEALTGHHFSLGIGLGMINRYRDYRQIIIENFNDPGILQGTAYNVWQLDASMGFQYHYESADGKYDFKISAAANRLPLMFEEINTPFRFDQVAHLTFNTQVGFLVNPDLVLEPGIQHISLLSDFELKAGGTSMWLRATYQRKFWAALYARPNASTVGLMMGAVLNQGKTAATLAIDSHAQLGTTWELGGFANFSPSAKCLDEIEKRPAFWGTESSLQAHLGSIFMENGLNIDKLKLSHLYGNTTLNLGFSLPEEDENELIWQSLPQNENAVRIICTSIIRDALEVCKEPHLNGISKIKLIYYSSLSAFELNGSAAYTYDASMGDGLILLGKLDGKSKRRAIFEGDQLSRLEFQLAKLYSLKSRLEYRLSDLGVDKNIIEVEILTGQDSKFPYQVLFELK